MLQWLGAVLCNVVAFLSISIVQQLPFFVVFLVSLVVFSVLCLSIYLCFSLRVFKRGIIC